jgi:5-oxoprolinase (ATP-hydrolysing) subunit A
VDLNSDIGEGFGAWKLGDDAALLSVVTSANVACGFHAGDPSTMARVCATAAANTVAVGAQVGYRDLAGFGRRRIEYDLGELRDDLLYQIGALSAFASVRYVKPHGALYNTAAVDAGQAGAVVAAVSAWRERLPVLCQPGSVLARLAARAGLTVVSEGFPDRGYLDDGRLAPRGTPGALIVDPPLVAARAVRMAVEGVVESVTGATIACSVESLCVHGDTPGASALARAIRDALIAEKVAVSPFAENRVAGSGGPAPGGLG